MNPGGILKIITERVIGEISVRILQEIPDFIFGRILCRIHENKFRDISEVFLGEISEGILVRIYEGIPEGASEATLADIPEIFCKNPSRIS